MRTGDEGEAPSEGASSRGPERTAMPATLRFISGDSCSTVWPRFPLARSRSLRVEIGVGSPRGKMGGK